MFKSDKEYERNGFTYMQFYGYNVMLSGSNVFLTGDAGTGKSYLLNRFIRHCLDNNKNIAVTAPTGIAALNINGATLHRTFKLGLNPLVTPISEIKVPGILMKIDTIIIDEISMCRIDLFEHVMKAIGKANKQRKINGKPVIQIVVCGDFFQLPPVITERDKAVLNEYYGCDIGKGYAFQSSLWNKVGFVNIVLNEVVRQHDKKFANILNGARIGIKSSIGKIRELSAKEKIENAIILTYKNKEVDDINNSELRKIKAGLRSYEADIDGEVKESDKPTLDILNLKVSARVMTLINDGGGKYKNGSLGTISGLTDDYIYIAMDSTGEEVKISKYTWNIIKYSFEGKKLKGDVIGTFTQFPVKLAYAITIHKSQGQTYDAVNLNPYAWECGQLYVALSRVKSIENLHLLNFLSENYLITSRLVQDFYRNLK